MTAHIKALSAGRLGSEKNGSKYFLAKVLTRMGNRLPWRKNLALRNNKAGVKP